MIMIINIHIGLWTFSFCEYNN